MFARRSPAVQIALVLLVWAPVAQVLGSLGFWFAITRGDWSILVVGLAFGGGVAGILGVPFVVVALLLTLLGHPKAAGVLALMGGLVSAISIVAIAAGVCLVLSPESRGHTERPRQDVVTAASDAAMG